ncbi:OB-fold domain-containing protein [Amycolatopsis anabasis]|uniref:OB-fold domain-containing protein n=1 Tax=Amycolatopsis anabasis TaxID=1840409 RepID=UPI00131E4B06|nr:OB-fold domain-containing protein [Amycolatopsis anabasis]
MSGIVAYGGYVPAHRISRNLLHGNGKRGGSRSVAGYDEDTTTMGVEAARRALAGLQAREAALYFSTAAPAYLDKTNATTLHAALDLDETAPAADLGGGPRSGAAALRLGLGAARRSLVVLSDIRTGLPGSADERDGGDGAAAFLVADSGPFVAEYLGGASRSAEFFDRWRLPGAPAAQHAHEQFGAEVLVPLGEAALTDALAEAGVPAHGVDRLVVAGSNARAVRQVATGLPAERVDRPEENTGDAGTAQPGLLLAAVLDRAGPDETIALLVLADGAEAFVFRTTTRLAAARRAEPPARTIDVGYPTFLNWRGLLATDATLRPPPAAATPPASYRANRWRLALYAGVCRSCRTRQFPPQRVCARCRSSEEPELVRLADSGGVITALTMDRIAWTPQPPATFAVVDLDGGARLHCELTDVDGSPGRPGDRVAMTFRRRYTTDGRHTYFWKARPAHRGEN